jgi:hypothetical protein
MSQERTLRMAELQVSCKPHNHNRRKCMLATVHCRSGDPLSPCSGNRKICTFIIGISLALMEAIIGAAVMTVFANSGMCWLEGARSSVKKGSFTCQERDRKQSYSSSAIA